MPADYRRSLHEMELANDDLFIMDQHAAYEKYNLAMLREMTRLQLSCSGCSLS